VLGQARSEAAKASEGLILVSRRPKVLEIRVGHLRETEDKVGILGGLRVGAIERHECFLAEIVTTRLAAQVGKLGRIFFFFL